MVSATPYFISEYVLYSVLTCFAFAIYILSHVYVKMYYDEFSKNDWIQICILFVLLIGVLASQIRIGGLFFLFGVYITLAVQNAKIIHDTFK